jgi:small-conductance mechanosensitive channel
VQVRTPQPRRPATPERAETAGENRESRAARMHLRQWDYAMHQMIDDPFVIVIPSALLLVTLLAGLLARNLLFRAIRSWAKRADSKLDLIILDTLRRPIILWALILGLHLATQHSAIPPRYLLYIPKTLKILWGLSFTIAISQFAGNMVRFYGGGAYGIKAVTSLSQKLVQFSILIVGIMWLLKVVFDFSLTPILTTLGVGGLAVALALQDTLSNLFAGFYVSVSGLVRIDDYIRLNTGEEGYITDINWRCTTMRTRFNNLVVIPNNKLGQAIFTNYFLPDGRMLVTILCGVSADSDPDRVEKLLLEEAMAAAKEVESLLTDPPPSVRFNPGPWNDALIFQIVFSVGQFVDQPVARSELRKRVYRRLRKEGIAVTFPATTTPSASESAGD